MNCLYAAPAPFCYLPDKGIELASAAARSDLILAKSQWLP